MTARVAIIADDLTGAFDTSAPFVRHGLSVAVAVSPAGLGEIAHTAADIIVVNAGTRERPQAEAIRRIQLVAETIAAIGPEIVFKKIDSRLKGHVGAETAALASALDLPRLLVAPAVPDQGRLTEAGMVTGTGVTAPIAIAPLFSATSASVRVADARSDADLDAVVATIAPGTLLVGARGLGAALARRLGRPALEPAVAPATSRLLMAIGSRDPITARQLEHLRRRHPGVAMVEAVDGQLSAGDLELPLVLYCGGSVVPAKAGIVAARFAEGIAGLVRRTRPDCLWMSGGETALAILDALAVSLVNLVGEVAPGVPLVACTMADGGRLDCVLKSGGFGSVDVLEAALRDRGALAGMVTGG